MRGRRDRRILFATILGAAVLFVIGCVREERERLEWTSMGTVAAVQARGADARLRASHACREAQAIFREIESLLNAHDETSELSRLAPLDDAAVLSTCTPRVKACYEAAFRLARLTDGAFSPRWRGAGTLDLGAIAKGFAVDEAAHALARETCGDLLLDLGGNLKAVRGAWRVGIVGSDEEILLTNGMACATSATYFRGAHIRDARTGEVVSNAVFSVTVVHPTSAMAADALSTTLFILGRARGEAFLKSHVPDARAYWVDHTR